MKVRESLSRLQREAPELTFCAFIFLLVVGVVALIFLFDPRSSFWIRALGLLAVIGCGVISPSVFDGMRELDWTT